MEMMSSNYNQKRNTLNQSIQDASLQEAILAKGQSILDGMQSESKSLFNKDWWYGRIMDWSMQNENFKTQMFRFVDVLPYLNSGAEVARHLKEYFAEKEGQLPAVFNFGLGMSSLAPGLLAGAVKKNVTQMAKMFITGESEKDALPVLKKARKKHLCFTVDLLGEATLSETEAADYHQRYTKLIDWLTEDANTWESIEQIDTDENGAIPTVNVSVKVTSLYSQIKEAAWDETIEILKTRLRPIFRQAMQKNVFINVDMEQYAHKNLTLEVFKQLLMESEFKAYRHWGIVIQAYLRDSLKDVQDLTEFATTRGTPFTIRLVKGAYWDYEVIHARQKEWPIPVFTEKQESDYNYEVCAKHLLENYPHIRLAVGSHNVRSISTCLVMAEQLGLPQKAIEIQMLYGMAEPIKYSLIQKGYRVREYATVGELIPGMAYLVRRLLENTSNESWLKNKFADNVSTEKLLADPAQGLKTSLSIPPKKPEHFYNHPPLDFSIEHNRHEMLKALKATESQLGKTYPLIIDSEAVETQRTIRRVNPSHPQQVVGEVCVASAEEAELAVASAKKAFSGWSQVPGEQRADLLDKVADLMDRDRFYLSAVEIREVGKTWAEADGDICEAIDFCRYYAREMRRLSKGQRTGHSPGEVSWYHYQARGITLVIAPWNFPLAILTGMTMAAAVTGNTVIMKPAEQSSVIAWHLMQLVKEAGFPNGVINFLPGFGEEVGEYLTGHKDISLIAFTGSKPVGLHIFEKAGQTHPLQKAPKKCIIEMGGKNAIIIDSDADLDEAVTGVVYSAFGFQGQKCSACSRAIVVGEIYDRFVERLIEATRSIHVGFSEDPKSYMGPIVDSEAAEKIKSTIEHSKAGQELIFQGETPTEGFFVPPTIFTQVDPQSELAQEEIFGPVLAVIKVKDIDEAIQVANDTQYGLTGGMFSRSPANIALAKRTFNVGNLYINRGNTGAIVERHPFGGFKMSGIGSKTGGPDYLLQFMDPRVVTENTLRRGFAPAERDDD